MKIEKFLAMLMSAMVMMLCFSACDDKDEPKPEPKPEPDPFEVPAPEFGNVEPSKIEALQKEVFLEVFEYTGFYKHNLEKFSTDDQPYQEEKWYFYPADEEEAGKMRLYAHDGCLYNDYWKSCPINKAYSDLFIGWYYYCNKKFGASRKAYVYTGFDFRYFPQPLYLNDYEVSIKTFDDSQFVLESNHGRYDKYRTYSFTGKTYDDTNCQFYGSLHDGAEKMLREIYEYYGSANVSLNDGSPMGPDKNGNPIPGSLAFCAKQLGVTL